MEGNISFTALARGGGMTTDSPCSAVRKQLLLCVGVDSLNT